MFHMCSLKAKKQKQKKQNYYTSPPSKKAWNWWEYRERFKENRIFGYGAAKETWGVVGKGRGRIITIF